MAERSKHLFVFNADKIAKAAEHEAAYHESRLAFWRVALREAMDRVKATAKIVAKEYAVTGGTRLDLTVDYGDMAAYTRMQEAQGKIERHKNELARFRSDATVYGSQGTRTYELDADDVHHFRLGGREREE